MVRDSGQPVEQQGRRDLLGRFHLIQDPEQAVHGTEASLCLCAKDLVPGDEQGHTQVRTAADIEGIPEFVAAGASLGHLWIEGQFGMSDPLRNQGAPWTIEGARRGH